MDVGVRIVADGKAVCAVVAFAPPAVQDAEIQAAVAAGFHAAGAGGFERAARIVQPDVAAGNHLPRDMDVVVLDENQMAFQFAVFAQVNDVLDVALAFVVARMRFAGENELDGTRLVVARVSRRFRIAGKSAGRVCRWRSGARNRS